MEEETLLVCSRKGVHGNNVSLMVVPNLRGIDGDN